MMTSELTALPDETQRAQALDVTRSFIVQAPAGSGKTELLVQRLLALLASVDAPEEVIAITFTRKAAGEMRLRVLDALDAARAPEPAGAPHQARSWRLAHAVLRRDNAMGWNLSATPGRLRVMTIDSFCAGLCRQMPLTAVGSHLSVTEDVEPLYVEAARRTLALLGEETQWTDALTGIVSHLDSNLVALERMLVGMLRRRDQWLRHMAYRSSAPLDRERLERNIQNWIEDSLREVVARCPKLIASELLELARFAASNVNPEKKRVAVFKDLTAFPGSSHSDAEAWQGIADLLLTQKNELRKQVDVRDGFPPAKEPATRELFDDRKSRMLELLREMANHPKFLAILPSVRDLPPARYTEVQWQALGALSRMLPVLAAQLQLVFNERGAMDFSAVALSAVRALGTDEEPTDLALSLDHRIRHLLVDEFQDTSQLQFDLLEGLTRGWQEGDGRTLFLVGDPMQSIYRFREADVGLFLRARHSGIGMVRLEALTLRANFRSQAGLVQWCNDCFSRVLPREENSDTDAVPHAFAQSVRRAGAQPPVVVDLIAGKNDRYEADRVITLVRSLRGEHPSAKIAILVGGRKHLGVILPALRQADIPLHAVDIESLSDRPLVQDLLALTRALLHPADRVAWLALLRAPWCGLSLVDLEALAQLTPVSDGVAIQDVVFDGGASDSLSEDGRARLAALAARLGRFVEHRDRVPLRRWIEGAWLALGGPAACESEDGLQDAIAFFDMLDKLDQAGEVIDFSRLQRKVESLFLQSSVAPPNAVQVMTIHKSKGLEFDHVILPGLGYKLGRDEAQILRWMERTREAASAELLIAPIGADGDSTEPLHFALKKMDSARANNEAARLLYVAATRAREQLHLLGHIALDQSGTLKDSPIAGSSLARLWSVLSSHLKDVQSATQPSPPMDSTPRLMQRFVLGWEVPSPDVAVVPRKTAASEASNVDVEFSWASEVARQVGVAVHQLLQRIADDGLDGWKSSSLQTLRNAFQRRLRAAGVPEDRLREAVTLASTAIRAVIEDARGHWILSAHSEARSELRLSGALGSEIVSVAMDRTFVDEQGVRWIIDYKTSPHEGAEVERFLDNERARYSEQLERYAALLKAAGETRPIRLALYFPLQRGWREWAANVTSTL